MSETPSHQINLLDFLAFLLRWRRFLVVIVLGIAALVATMTFVVHPKYRSVAVIRAQDSGGGNLAALLAAKVGAMSGMSNLPGFGDVPEEVFVSILKSRWMTEKLIDAFDLRTVYGMKDTPIEDVILVVSQRSRFELDPLSTTLAIYVDDTDPKRAHDMVQFYVDQLDKRNQELKSTGARREREFIGERLGNERVKLSSLEDSLSIFQLRTGVINPEEQVKVTLQAAAALEAQRLLTQTDVEMNNQLHGPGNVENVVLRMKLASIDSSLQSLTQSRSDKRDRGFLLRLEESPTEGMAYIRYMRDIQVEQMLVGFLTQEFEQAKIEEQRNTPTIMRLDPPSLATIRVWPKRGMLTVVAAVFAFVFGSVVALVIEFVNHSLYEPSHPQHERILRIRDLLTKSKGENA